MTRSASRTVGVEEELLLVTAADGRPAALGEAVVPAEPESGSSDLELTQIDHEFKKEQAETASKPAAYLQDLRDELIELRSRLATAARSRGGLAVASATSPLKIRPHTTVNGRYERMTAEFGLVARQQLTCGQHVHVSVESREEGVAVLDRIRPWLAVLNAISANSPFWQGADTGYASYRNILWNQWPTAGPTDAFGSVAEYDRRVADLVSSGAALDDGMIYFDARLSAQYPTVEIRVADVCSSVDDAVLIAALCRALVETTADEARRGLDFSPPGVGVLRAAAWRAARWGLAGTLVDVSRGGTKNAMRLVDELVDYIRPALVDYEDEELVDSGIGLLRERGTGADAQREWARERGGLATVVSRVAERTSAV